MPEFYLCSEGPLYTDAKWDFEDMSNFSKQYLEIADFMRMVNATFNARCSNGCSEKEKLENVLLEAKISSLSGYYQYVGMSKLKIKFLFYRQYLLRYH